MARSQITRRRFLRGPPHGVFYACFTRVLRVFYAGLFLYAIECCLAWLCYTTHMSSAAALCRGRAPAPSPSRSRRRPPPPPRRRRRRPRRPRLSDRPSDRRQVGRSDLVRKSKKKSTAFIYVNYAGSWATFIMAFLPRFLRVFWDLGGEGLRIGALLRGSAGASTRDIPARLARARAGGCPTRPAARC